MTTEVAPLAPGRGLASPWLSSRNRRQALVRELIVHSPRLGLRCAETLVRLLHRMGRSGPPTKELAALIPDAERDTLGPLAREIAARSYKSECIDLLKRRPGAARRLRDVLLDADAMQIVASIQGPTVLTTLHAGPLIAARWVLELAEVPTLVIAYDSQVEMEAGHVRLDTKRAPTSSRATVIVAAVSFLKRHERSVVLVAPDDGAAQRPVPVEMLGSWINFRPGAAAIARLADARILPTMARWVTPTLIGVSADEPFGVDAPETDAAATRRLGRLAGAHFERHPEDLSTFYVSRLANPARSSRPSRRHTSSTGR